MKNFVRENIPFSDPGHLFAIGSKQGSTSRLQESSKSLGRSFVIFPSVVKFDFRAMSLF